eukprot:3455458-Prymnesium_polylepis.2
MEWLMGAKTAALAISSSRLTRRLIGRARGVSAMKPLGERPSVMLALSVTARSARDMLSECGPSTAGSSSARRSIVSRPSTDAEDSETLRLPSPAIVAPALRCSAEPLRLIAPASVRPCTRPSRPNGPLEPTTLSSTKSMARSSSLCRQSIASAGTAGGSGSKGGGGSSGLIRVSAVPSSAVTLFLTRLSRICGRANGGGSA